MFVTALCIVLSFWTYNAFSHTIYSAYQQRLSDVLNYVEAHIDIDDLSECVRTGRESDKYRELRDFCDNICDNVTIQYLYICKPVYENGKYGMLSILAADTTYNRVNNPDGLYLGYVTENGYSDKEVKNFMTLMDKEGINFFKNRSEWGYDYTAMKVLTDSRGERFGALCVDFEVDDMEKSINTYLVVDMCIVVILGIMFTAFFLRWINLNITDPISKLKESVVAFAAKSHNKKELSRLNYINPGINTGNEVEELSDAVVQMTEDIRSYIRNVLDAEDKVENMRHQVDYMGSVAYQDPLTKVKNKAWYEKAKDRLDQEIASGLARFGLAMVDLNRLKMVNDNYGHERGDEYIFGTCRLICSVFVHSGVCRIGGDEFVVILENTDFDNREFLMAKLTASLEKASGDETRDPWRRYSAAVGLAVFDSDIDNSVDDVFRRADSMMYEDKQRQKATRRE